MLAFLLVLATLFSTPAFSESRCVVASYYSEGKRTANGERYNPNGFTAAHRTLPFGTRLHVTNPRTGRSVTVRINDRGPFIRGRSLDLSKGAARAIGLTHTGVGRVCYTR
jgi:rare lipoprotein A